MNVIWNRVNNQSLSEFKFRFKSSEKKKYLYADKLPANDLKRISTALFTRLFLKENGQVVTDDQRFVGHFEWGCQTISECSFRLKMATDLKRE